MDSLMHALIHQTQRKTLTWDGTSVSWRKLVKDTRLRCEEEDETPKHSVGAKLLRAQYGFARAIGDRLNPEEMRGTPAGFSN